MPSITIHTQPSVSASKSNATNPLPGLLHTPLGLAIIDIQGTLNMPASSSQATTTASLQANGDTLVGQSQSQLPIGRLIFPHLQDQGSTLAPGGGAEEGPWMKRVYFYVGETQRLVGEVKKLPKVIAVLQRRDRGADAMDVATGLNHCGQSKDELEIAALVRYKILFNSRPEFI